MHLNRMIPFSTRFISAGVFIFADTDQSQSGFPALEILLQNIVLMIGDKLDKISMERELEKMNESIENSLEERTEELQMLIKKLQQEAAEQKKVLESVSESEEKYRLLFNAERDACLVVDSITKMIIDVNPAASRLYGNTKKEFLKMTALDLSANPELSKIHVSDMEKIDKHAVSRQNNLHRKKDGSVFPVEVSAGNFEYGGHKMIYAVFRDIGERIKAEDQLRQLSQSVEQSPVSVVITDVAGNIEYVNPKFSQVTGYTFDEVRGKNPRILKSGSKSAEEYKVLWETITSGKEWQGEF